MSASPVLAVIPARGGSKGLPGKKIRSFAGVPLIAHSIMLARMCPQVDRCIVSTDSQEIAEVAQEHGGDVPFIRPAELARDDTPMWPVLQHALLAMEQIAGRRYETLLLLDPTSPGRLPQDIVAAIDMLECDTNATGVIAVSEPHFNPRWVCVEERDGYMVPSFDSRQYSRRQDVPKSYRINALLYLWRRDYLLSHDSQPSLGQSRHRMLVVPEERAIHIDELHDFRTAELLIQAGIVRFPWLQSMVAEENAR